MTLQVTPHVERLIAVVRDEMSRGDLMDALGMADRNHFAAACLRPALEAVLVEMTFPEHPRSPAQRCRLTEAGEQIRHSTEQPGTG